MLPIFRPASAFAGLACTALSQAPTSQAQTEPLVGLNLAEMPYYGDELVFSNVSRHFLPWYAQKDGELFREADTGAVIFGSTGLPASIAEGHSADSRWDRPVGSASGAYEVSWEGEGDFEFLRDTDRISNRTSNGYTIELAPVVEGQNQAEFLRIESTDASNPLRNLEIRQAGNADTTFQPEFIERWEDIGTFRYMDWAGTNNSEVSRWEDRAQPDDATQATLEKGVALEFQIEHANETGAQPWFHVPHLADDDYIRNAAELIRDNLDDGLTARIEYSNEVWNNSFDQGKHAQAEGLAEGLAGDPFTAGLRWGSRRAVEVFDIFEDVFTEEDPDGLDRLVRVIGGQASNSYTSTQVLLENDAFEHVDALGVAPYFGTVLNTFDNEDPTQTSAEIWRATIVREGDTAEEAAAKDEARFELVEASLQQAFGWMELQAEILEDPRFADIELFAAEAGQAFQVHPGLHEDEELVELLADLNRDPKMEELYLRYLTKWEEVGGADILLFNSVSEYGRFGNWGLLEHEGQTAADSAKLRGVNAFLATQDGFASEDGDSPDGESEPQVVPTPAAALAAMAVAPVLLLQRRRAA